MQFRCLEVLSVSFLAGIAARAAKFDGPDYHSLPLDTIFPGPWESNIRAPFNKSYITPNKIFKFEGAVSGLESVLQDAKTERSISWVIGLGGLVTFEFGENVAGKVCFEVDSIKGDPYVVLAYSESSFFADRECDATGDDDRDLPLSFSLNHTGTNCVGGGYNRGGFKYLTVYMPTSDTPTEGGYWHEGHSAPKISVKKQSWYHTIRQKLLGLDTDTKNEALKEPAVTISKIWVNCTAFPSNPNGRAYTGYFDSSSSILNRVWYAGAYTLQLSTLDPKEGGSLINFNRNFDHNRAPPGAWYSNYTIANGTAVTTDGAKRDRMVWPGDMTIAVPGIAVSTYDMLAVRNALDIIYHRQYSDGSMPYAGPPMGAFGEFSDTYHLHTLVGTYQYVLYSGDLDWLEERWNAYTTALAVSIRKVDETGLLHVSSRNDWIRPGMTGHNVEASSILLDVLANSIKLASWIGKNATSDGEDWSKTRQRLYKGISTLYCQEDGLYGDNIGRRGCSGPEKVLPQDGNSWALISGAVVSGSTAYNVSENLRKRWVKAGAPAVEFPNVISPFASSFELLGHSAANNNDAAVELIEHMWGFMLDGPGMTNSTLCEGYRIDGYIHYPAYWQLSRNSHAHGWATGPTTVLMQGILGIKLLSPLGETWEIQPKLTKWLSYARGGFATKLGKFEVSIALMRSLSTSRRVEALNVTYPAGTEGLVTWGDKAQFRSEDMGTSFSIYRYLDVASQDRWQTWGVDDVHDFVEDKTWIKPQVEERPEGVVDWKALEENYVLAKQRFTASDLVQIDDWAVTENMTAKRKFMEEGTKEDL
ncbi:alpha-L-rhamnosidase [Drepanopeziza brunnea f. sp. 'multigermtubi' MB_m1]|uniref:Alpha-L-rhamnosidase n=1 Tax=Marssonina brunnea f. sp. multigermtubi (strain MB_m1) TaxID=1072389 RepID=K1WRQ1_MARBU|nr:alpha-L-rhamnosidase [Drepanopeziza brunnea f. sp. 'multigermtubi' MB_m1]EKD20340.1 alpha-L-rhamnosidase [Drepanopeziza brunnea f. sp. 'multigermtubi' MB_m1]